MVRSCPPVTCPADSPMESDHGAPVLKTCHYTSPGALSRPWDLLLFFPSPTLLQPAWTPCCSLSSQTASHLRTIALSKWMPMACSPLSSFNSLLKCYLLNEHPPCTLPPALHVPFPLFSVSGTYHFLIYHITGHACLDYLPLSI